MTMEQPTKAKKIGGKHVHCAASDFIVLPYFGIQNMKTSCQFFRKQLEV